MSTNTPGHSTPLPTDIRSAAGPSNGEKQNVTISDVSPMKRPAYGRYGTPIHLESNFFELKIPDNLRVHYFDVSFTRESKDRQGNPFEKDVTTKFPVKSNRNTLECLRIREKLFKYRPAYDGRSAIFSVEDSSLHIGGDEPYIIKVNDDGFDESKARENEKLTKTNVYITYIKSINFEDLRSGKIGNVEGMHFLQCLDIALASAPIRDSSFVQVGRSFYSDIRTSPLTSRDTVASAWSGFYQSVRQTGIGLHLNVDFSCTAFWNGGGCPLMTVLEKFHQPLRRCGWGNSRNFESVIRKLSYAFNGIKVKATHNQLSYSTYGFSKYGASDMTFNLDNRQVTIAEYFANQYNCILQYPSWPCVKVHRKKEVYIPIELLVVKPNQPYKGNIIGEAQATMVRHATAEPRVVRNAAQENIREVEYHTDEVCRSFGLSVSDKLAKLPGRVLPTPLMQYERIGNEQTRASVREGSWAQEANGNKLKFIIPGRPQEWGILNTSRLDNGDVRSFAADLKSALIGAGFLELKNPHFASCSEENVAWKIHQMCEEQRISRTSPVHRMSLIVVIKERQDTKCYSAIKVAGDLTSGTITQACLARNCANRSRNRKQYISQLILKINAKLGGVNCYPLPFEISHPGTIPDPPFIHVPNIVLGADVSHPSAGGPSVAALVGSLDRFSSQFAACIRNQKGRQEIISDMGLMFNRVYTQWRIATAERYHASAIIMFRDGVSEGQFKEVMEKEISSIRETCLSFDKEFKPKITYILITKRHHVRFFPSNPRTGDRNGNIIPGTVVDTHVTSNDFYDFYVNSHSAIRGTNKPSKYTVLLDENNIPPDVLQAYIFRLSHTYCRTNGSVSMVNSAYYAHHLASRGRLYLSKTRSDDNRKSTGKRGRGGAHRNERPGRNQRSEPEVPEAPTLHPAHVRRLFFV